ncbi:MAG TPA: hydrogenase maturation protease [Pirellulales bacterium]|jgi:hydrogenase maturation protease|nr:hydrogenase maturation protease [Pirellulales bacterium]
MSDARTGEPRILVAGIGNIFFGDDAFGCEVVRRLGQRSLPPEVRVVDFGIRGLDLAYAMLENYELIVLVDAAPRGEEPGTLYVIEPAAAAESEPPEAAATAGPSIEMHSLTPAKVLEVAAMWGGPRGRVIVVGCEPTPLADPDDMQMELSEPVRAAIDAAGSLVESLILQHAPTGLRPLGAT